MAGSAIKLADFGLSINAEQERPVTRAGTLDYMAPEVRAWRLQSGELRCSSAGSVLSSSRKLLLMHCCACVTALELTTFESVINIS